MANGSTILFIVLTLVIDVFVEGWWGSINSATNYVGWSAATVLMYQQVLPLGISASLAGAITGKAR